MRGRIGAAVTILVGQVKQWENPDDGHVLPVAFPDTGPFRVVSVTQGAGGEETEDESHEFAAPRPCTVANFVAVLATATGVHYSGHGVIRDGRAELVLSDGNLALDELPPLGGCPWMFFNGCEIGQVTPGSGSPMALLDKDAIQIVAALHRVHADALESGRLRLHVLAAGTEANLAAARDDEVNRELMTAYAAEAGATLRVESVSRAMLDGVLPHESWDLELTGAADALRDAADRFRGLGSAADAEGCHARAGRAGSLARECRTATPLTILEQVRGLLHRPRGEIAELPGLLAELADELVDDAGAVSAKAAFSAELADDADASWWLADLLDSMQYLIHTHRRLQAGVVGEAEIGKLRDPRIRLVHETAWPHPRALANNALLLQAGRGLAVRAAGLGSRVRPGATRAAARLQRPARDAGHRARRSWHGARLRPDVLRRVLAGPRPHVRRDRRRGRAGRAPRRGGRGQGRLGDDRCNRPARGATCGRRAAAHRCTSSPRTSPSASTRSRSRLESMHWPSSSASGSPRTSSPPAKRSRARALTTRAGTSCRQRASSSRCGPRRSSKRDCRTRLTRRATPFAR